LSSALREIIETLLDLDEPTREDLDVAKYRATRRYSLGRVPSNSEIIAELSPKERERLVPLLRRKATRAMSGVNVVAVMTEPRPCPHGRCAYCPGGPEAGSPQSYTGHEPAAMRGSQNMFDPGAQVRSRIEQLRAIGHTVDKVDLIIMGGTFPASPRGYQEWFVKGCLDAITGFEAESLEETKLRAESSMIRNVGITVETRPDCLQQNKIGEMLSLGVTRVEVGVQNVYDDIYMLVNRGHTVRNVVDGTRRLKDSSLKVCYHMMPGLPGSDLERDLEGFRRVLDDPAFRPDMLKIYPTLVVKGTKLYDWWRRGEYEPYTTEEAAELVARVKEMVPPWVRIMRVQRDIPLHQIEAGVDKSNLRQLAHGLLAERGSRCRCIRCREAGHRAVEGVEPENLDLIHHLYEASGGTEDFISVEDAERDVLVGFLRLRLPSDEALRPEVTVDTGLVRELHVYGSMTPVGAPGVDWQHRGWGEALMVEAERVAGERGMRRMLVMSALGTREYYRRLGYADEGPYVSRSL